MNKSSQKRNDRVVAPVYDILNCGPNNRFVANGKLVHNSGGNKYNLQSLPRGGTLRYALQAPPGRTLLMCDLAQIEARVVAWVAGEEQMLNAFRENKDLYCEVASQIFNKPVNKNDHPDERFCGKAAVLGLNYGMGSAKFKQFCKNMGRNLEEDFCQQVVTAYRERYNRIVALWNFMGEGIKIMANVPLKTPSSFFSSNVPLATLPPATDKIRFTHSRMHLPSGRTLKYNGLTPLEGNMWRLENKRKIYSCLLVENAVQAISADILCDAILAIKDLYTIVMTTHDEIVISIPDADVETAQADLLRIMCTPPSWGLDIPLAASTGSGKNYGECK